GIGGHSLEGLAASEKALSLIDQLSDERDARYVRLKAGCGAAFGHLSIGDLIKARAVAKDLMDFAAASGSARALAFAYWSSAGISYFTGDVARAITEAERARDAAVDPSYKGFIEPFVGLFLTSAGRYVASRAVTDQGLRFTEGRGYFGLTLQHQLSEALVLLGEGELTRGMDQIEAIKRRTGELRWGWLHTVARLNEAVVYARIATGEAKGSLAAFVRHPGFVIGRARRASHTARDALASLSENLSPELESLRFVIEYEFAKLLVKRKEYDEARRHIEKAIAFLLPLGDSVGMRDARALLATIDAR
ncbi:MAG TPA: hypothetical protein VGR43_11060, partial [Dehalococcoidia bacterium]|nr:hypothetical protein [Dehalococcoidia bacterium]